MAFAANTVEVSLTGSANTVTYGQSVTLKSTVTDNTEGSNRVPVGSLTFYDNGSVIIGPQSLVPQSPEIIRVVSPPGSVPSGYKQACMIDGRNNNPVGAPDCPVLKWGEYTFWGYSDNDNNNNFNIVQYDGKGNIVNQDIVDSDFRYLYDITLNNNTQMVTFWGQGNKEKELSFSYLKAANSTASLTTPVLSVGSHVIQAKYVSSDSQQHADNESLEFIVNVPKTAPTVSLTSSVASSVYGERASFTAVVPSVSGLVPTGEVIFYDGTVEVGRSNITSAVYSTASLALGVHKITASYSGDDNFESRTSSPLNYTVNAILSNLSLTSSSSQVAYGTGVTFTAQVPSINNIPITGTVTFNDGTNLLGIVPVGTDGTAQWSAPLLSVGSHTITANYSGDSHYSASSQSVLQSVDKIGSIINVKVPLSTIVGDALGADVDVVTLGNVVPTGTVDIIIDNQTVASSDLDGNGRVYFKLPQLSVGSYTLQAAYRGTDMIKDSVSLTQTLNVLNPLNNVGLSGIRLSSGTLTPVFSAGTTSYKANVANNTSSIIVTPSTYDSLSTVTVNGEPVLSGQASGSIHLNVGSNLISIVVTAQDGTTKTYTVTVTRAQASSSNDGGSSASSGGSSSSTSSSDTVTSTNGKLTLPVGKTGEVNLGDAIKISIPANAAGKELNLTIEKVADTENLLTQNDILSSPIFEILKNFSENFSKEITMTFAFDPNSLKGNQVPVVFYYDELKQVWVKVGGEVNGNTITVKVNHLTKYAVFAIGQASDATENTKQPTNFSDISGHWAEANIKQAVSAGILSGYPDGTFKPNDSITRAEFAVMLMNALKPQGDGVALTFVDKTKIGTWAQKSVMQAVNAGFITGYDDNTFRPNVEITRPEMAVMIAKVLAQSFESVTATGFEDDRYIPDWAKGAVAAMKNLGIIEGKGMNQFAPSEKTTRAEAVTVLLKMLAQKK
ncbi:hypothetical protein GCM10008013_18400 [Paenibacillus segetis]|uniref:SLH domain-containing protein n=1 Tax=Paenibacillus segetis TaxID=1325360 RepID=A0ABQ1YCY3_9BACL|nr:hypothetical protein GCM10008013_18400 [Paenibacillus segetis]